MFLFKFLYLVDYVIFLHVFLLNLSYDFRNVMLFIFQTCFFLLQVCKIKTALVQVEGINEAFEVPLQTFVLKHDDKIMGKQYFLITKLWNILVLKWNNVHSLEWLPVKIQKPAHN